MLILIFVKGDYFWPARSARLNSRPNRTSCVLVNVIFDSLLSLPLRLFTIIPLFFKMVLALPSRRDLCRNVETNALVLGVDLRSRCSLSAGRAVSLLGAQKHCACGVSPVPLVPQESSTFRSKNHEMWRFT